MPKFSSSVQKLYDAARRSRKKVAPPKRKKPGGASRCRMLHEGQLIEFDLSTAKTCPSGFIAIRKGVSVKPVKVVETKQLQAVKRAAATAARKVAKVTATTTAKKTAKKVAKKAVKKAAKKRVVKKRVAKKRTVKRATKKRASSKTPAAMKAKLAALYKARKLGEASKLRAQMRRDGML